jgi:hypothetical protein
VLPSGGRPALATCGLAGLLAGLVLTGCAPTGPRPAPTQLVAAATDVAGESAGGLDTSDPEPSSNVHPGLTFGPLPTPEGPSSPTAIVPGTVGRSSMAVTATYRVYAAITVRTGALEVTTRIQVRNDSGEGIDRLELNTIAARLGGIDVYAASVDDVPVTVAIADQTLLVPLGGILPNGSSATVSVAYRATLRNGVTNSDWMFSRSGGTLALYRWVPWVSVALPFDRPNSGAPFVTASSPQVVVEILTDSPMVLAAPAVKVDEFPAGSGLDWSFTVNDVRDVSVVLAPDFRVTRAKAGEIPIRAYTRPGGLSGRQLADLAAAAIATEADRLGVAYPGTTLVVVQTPSGVALESPGLIWVPRGLDSRNRTYAVYQGVAHQWFYGLVGNDQRAEPFADEAPADLLARTVLGTLRASRCGRENLDDPITGYSRACYYEVVFVQGGALLDEVRRRMGTKRFWPALAGYVDANRLGLGGTKALLEALRAASEVDLLPLLAPRFPSLY